MLPKTHQSSRMTFTIRSHCVTPMTSMRLIAGEPRQPLLAYCPHHKKRSRDRRSSQGQPNYTAIHATGQDLSSYVITYLKSYSLGSVKVLQQVVATAQKNAVIFWSRMTIVQSFELQPNHKAVSVATEDFVFALQTCRSSCRARDCKSRLCEHSRNRKQYAKTTTRNWCGQEVYSTFVIEDRRLNNSQFDEAG